VAEFYENLIFRRPFWRAYVLRLAMTDEKTLTGSDKPGSVLKKLARISAWVLLGLIIIIVLSGWGITQTGVIYNLTFGLVDRKLADAIHRAANVPLALFFLTHVLINAKLSISKKTRSLGLLVNTALIVIGVAIMAVTVYLEYFRKGG
jgi:thiosulfate reductase cytochrome b subunit